MSVAAVQERTPMPTGSWQRERDDFVYRLSTGPERYREPLRRLGNSWDVLDLLAHLARKPTVSDEVLGGAVRALDGLFDFPTAFPRRCPGFDAIKRADEIERRCSGRVA